jgi:hypothetical protein
VTSKAASGSSSSGSFTDAPSTAGTYWYGIHAVDNAGNWAAENTPVKVSFTQVAVQNLTVNCQGSGSVSPQGCGTTQEYDEGTQVTLTASPASSYAFQGWSGACWWTGTCPVTLNSNKSATATFTEVTLQKVLELPLRPTLTNPQPYVRATVFYRALVDETYEVQQIQFSTQGASKGLVEFGIFPHGKYFPPLPPVPGTAKWKTYFLAGEKTKVVSLGLTVHHNDVMSLSFGGVADGSVYFGVEPVVPLARLLADLLRNALPVTTTFAPETPVSEATSMVNGGRKDLPMASLSASPTSGAAPLAVTFSLRASDPGGSISAWVLDVDGDGNADYSGTGNPPATQKHTYAEPGSYNVTFMVSDEVGANASEAEKVRVDPPPLEVKPRTPVRLEGKPAQDLDGDGLFEDLNGNGRLDFGDVLLLYRNLGSPVVLEHAELLDFNGDGLVDLADMVVLSKKVAQQST